MIFSIGHINNKFNNYKKAKNKEESTKQLVHLFDQATEELLTSISSPQEIRSKDTRHEVEEIRSQGKTLFDSFPSSHSQLNESYARFTRTYEAFLTLQEKLISSQLNENELKPLVRELAESNRDGAKQFVKACNKSPEFLVIRKVWKEVKADLALEDLSLLNASLSDKNKIEKMPRDKRLNYLLHLHRSLRADLLKGLSSEEQRHQVALKLKELSLIEMPTQKVEGVFSGQRKAEEAIITELSVIQADIQTTLTLLESYYALPKDLDSLEKIENPEKIREFCLAAQALIKQHPRFAYRFLAKLAKTDQNSFLKKLLEDQNVIDLGSSPVDVRLLEILATFSTALTEIRVETVSGDKSQINLHHCSTKVAASIIKHVGPELQKVQLSQQAFYLIKLDEEKRPYLANVRELVVRADETEKFTLEFEPEEITDHLFSCFPELHYIELPPIEIPKLKGVTIDSPWTVLLDVMFKFLHLEKLKTQDERVRHEIYRSLSKGGLDKYFLQNLTKPSYLLMNEAPPLDNFMLIDLVPLLNDPKSKGKLPAGWENKTEDNLYFYLASAQLLPQCIIDYKSLYGGADRYPINFSNIPLLDNDQLVRFMKARDDKNISNSLKIYKLNLSQCESITNKGVVEVMKTRNRIKKLILKENPQIDDQLFDQLPLDRLKDIKLIDLRQTSVSQGCLERLRKEYPRILFLWNEVRQCERTFLDKKEEMGNFDLKFKEENLLVNRDLFLLKFPKLAKKMIDQTEISLEMELSHEATLALARFVYTNSPAPLSTQTAFELIRFASDPAVSSYLLKSQCQSFLMRSLTPLNVVSRYNAAVENEDFVVRDACRRYIDLLCHPNDVGFFPKLPLGQQERIREIMRIEKPPQIPKNLHEITFKLEGTVDENPQTKSYTFSSTQNWKESVPKELHEEVTACYENPRLIPTLTLSKLVFPQPTAIEVKIKVETGIVNAWDRVNSESLKVDSAVEIIDVQGRSVGESHAVKSVLMSRSSYFLDLFENANANHVKIQTENPLECRQVFNALMRGETLSFQGRSLREILKLLEEADRLNVTDSVILNSEFRAWINNKEINPRKAVDLDWIKLFSWAKKHHNYQVGLELALIWRRSANEIMENRGESEVDKIILGQIISSPELTHFANYFLKNKNDAFDILFVTRDV